MVCVVVFKFVGFDDVFFGCCGELCMGMGLNYGEYKFELIGVDDFEIGYDFDSGNICDGGVFCFLFFKGLWVVVLLIVFNWEIDLCGQWVCCSIDGYIVQFVIEIVFVVVQLCNVFF